MLNWAEEYVYWYLRLQGFFTLNNFVHHGGDKRETDILAIKPANAKEIIDLRSRSGINLYSGEFSDQILLGELKIEMDSYETEEVKIIAEVTAKDKFNESLFDRKFNDYPFCRTQRRMGCNRSEDVKLIIFCLRKISDQMRKYEYPVIEIETCHLFIRERLNVFKEAKSFDWTRFDSTLIQSLIFEDSLQRD